MSDTVSIPGAGASKLDSAKICVYVVSSSASECDEIIETLDKDIDCVGCAHTIEAIEKDFLTKERIASSIANKYNDKLICDQKPFHVDVLITETHLDGKPLWKQLRKIRYNYPELDILVLTKNAFTSDIHQAIHSGATGYLLQSDASDISSSIRLIKGGGSPVSPIVAREVIKSLRQRVEKDTKKTPSIQETQQLQDLDVVCADSLSIREKEILHLLSKGLPFSSVGELLGISHHTVTAHVKKIYRKLQVHSRSEAVYEAACLGIIPSKTFGGR